MAFMLCFARQGMDVIGRGICIFFFYHCCKLWYDMLFSVSN